MISAERFARERSSYWNQLLPRLESFVRLLNLGVGRFSPPMAPAIARSRRAFVAELGFALFAGPAEHPIMPDDPHIDVAASSVRMRIASLSGRDAAEISSPVPVERQQAAAIANRLRRFVYQRLATSIQIDFTIPGCGILDHANVDLLITRPRFFGGDIDVDPVMLLYEVKTVTRPFRAGDVRQLVTYAALMAAAGEAPATVGVVNPRLGTFFETSLDRLVEDIAGVRANQLLQQIIFDVSAAEVSL